MALSTIIPTATGTTTNNYQTVDTTRQLQLGALSIDQTNGNIYIYLQGVASTVANDLVTYVAGTWATTRSVADAVGLCAIAQAAVVANDFGWYQIFGSGTVNTGAATTANSAVYLHATAGTVSTTGVAGDLVFGLLSIGGSTGASTSTVAINWPMVYDDDNIS